MGQYEVVVAAATQLTPRIRELVLTAADGRALPAQTPGTHIEVDVTLADGSAAQRSFWLIGGDENADDPPDTYRIAVERLPQGLGGSRYLHDTVPVGATLGISAPRTGISLGLHPANRMLIAGGIGIAPAYAMLRVLVKRGLPVTFHAIGRNTKGMAYRAAIERLAGDNAHFHDEASAPDKRIDVEPLVAALRYPADLYVCASRALTKAVLASAKAHGLSDMQIHGAFFDPPPPVVRDDTGFEVELRRSGTSFYVPPDSSILEMLMTKGVPAMFYCGRGECGTCPMPVIEADGVIEHRDSFLSAAEKASNERICICVSRLKGGTKLVLDG